MKRKAKTKVEIELTQGKKMVVSDTWANNWKWCYNRKYGRRANLQGYAVRRTSSKQTGLTLFHVARWEYLNGPVPAGFEVDHHDGDTLNNCDDNLRLATASQNHQNCHRYKNNSSGIKGVNWSKYHKKWIARIEVNGKRLYLGYFDSKEDATLTYDVCALMYHRDFAKINLAA